jgi:hypothetical protein
MSDETMKKLSPSSQYWQQHVLGDLHGDPWSIHCKFRGRYCDSWFGDECLCGSPWEEPRISSRSIAIHRIVRLFGKEAFPFKLPHVGGYVVQMIGRD